MHNNELIHNNSKYTSLFVMLKYPEVDEQYKTRAVEDSVFLRLASLFYRHTSRARHSCTHDRAVRAIVRPGGSRMRTRVRAGRIISVDPLSHKINGL